LDSPSRVSLFPDNTVLCNFGSVRRLDLLRKVLDGCGRWTEAVAEEARRSAAYVRDLAQLPAEGWLGEPIELCTDAEIALADRLRRAVFGGAPTEPLRHLGEAETLALIQTREEFAGAVWITDDRDAGEYATARGIPVKTSVTVMREAVVAGHIHCIEGHRLLLDMVAGGRHLRGVPERAERLLD
jgi:predicted nucleic acid-binding protein